MVFESPFALWFVYMWVNFIFLLVFYWVLKAIISVGFAWSFLRD